MVYLSICLCHLQFPSSVSYSFQSISLFASLGRFIPKYFILFDVMVNWIASLISFYDLLFVYRNAGDFCVLILYPAILPNSLMSSNGFLVVSLGFSRYSIMSSANSDSFTSLPICLFFFFFFCLF